MFHPDDAAFERRAANKERRTKRREEYFQQVRDLDRDYADDRLELMQRFNKDMQKIDLEAAEDHYASGLGVEVGPDGGTE